MRRSGFTLPLTVFPFALGLVLLLILGWGRNGGTPALAREQVDYWYIRDFKSDIQVHADSSLTVTERITADCGVAADKHGIFRILPNGRQVTQSEFQRSPVTLVNITDERGNPHPYQEMRSRFDKTITWKIGDPQKTVQGVNTYVIQYRVSNAILHRHADFDELYWNLNGNFWDMETDAFRAVISFPAGIGPDNTKLHLYSGQLGEKEASLAKGQWNAAGQLEVHSTRTLGVKEGITVSVTFPKGIIQPYSLTEEENRQYEVISPTLVPLLNILGILTPFLTWLLLHTIWRRIGRDPRGPKVTVPEFEIPQNLAPLDMSLIYRNGKKMPTAATATIVDLAVRGYLTIEKIPKTGLFGRDDYRLRRRQPGGDALSGSSQQFLEKLFGKKDEILMSELANVFATKVDSISDATRKDLIRQGILDLRGSTVRTVGCALIFFLPLIIGATLLFALAADAELYGAFFGLLLTLPIAFIYLILMPRRTESGLALLRKIQGYRLYLATAERYRAEFMERENIFERFLPYAILFGLTDQWFKAFSAFHGTEQLAHYAPAWWSGGSFDSGTGSSFDQMVSIFSSSMAAATASMPSSSGSGGGGFSGGGGGGGGGGGW
jgi:uncharacterized membrane protein